MGGRQNVFRPIPNLNPFIQKLIPGHSSDRQQFSLNYNLIAGITRNLGEGDDKRPVNPRDHLQDYSAIAIQRFCWYFIENKIYDHAGNIFLIIINIQ